MLWSGEGLGIAFAIALWILMASVPNFVPFCLRVNPDMGLHCQAKAGAGKKACRYENTFIVVSSGYAGATLFAEPSFPVRPGFCPLCNVVFSLCPVEVFVWNYNNCDSICACGASTY